MLESDSSQSQDEEINVVTGCSNPSEEYKCPLCNIVFADCGAHLLLQVCTKNLLVTIARREGKLNPQ